MTQLTLYAYTWAIGDTETVSYRVFPIEPDEIRLGMIPIGQVEVDILDPDPTALEAAKKRGLAQYRAAQRIKEQELAA
jgi:hypothetical protein